MMHTVLGHALILAGAGVGAIASAVSAEWHVPSTEPTAVVVTVPPRPSLTATPRTFAPPSVAQSPKAIPPPGDRAALTRELQRELKRVGCYDGEINGTWGPQSRKAMKAFTDHVNARLPIEQPDLILLTMVQGSRDRACDTPAAPRTAEADPAPPPVAVPPRLVAPPTEVKRPATKPEGRAQDQPRVVDVPPIKGPPAPAMREPSRLEPQAGPIPPAGVYEKASERAPPPTSSGPPKFVRSLIKGVQNVLAPLGVPY